MTGLDTDVLMRYITQDDSKQSAKATRQSEMARLRGSVHKKAAAA